MTRRFKPTLIAGMLILALAMPLYTPVANTVPGPAVTTIAKAEAKAILSKKEAKKILKKWMKKKKKWKKKMKMDYSYTEGKKYVFQVYYDMGDHIATYNWYYVNAYTGKIKAMF